MQMFAFEDFYRQEGAPIRSVGADPDVLQHLDLAMLRGRLCEFSSVGPQGVGSLALSYVWQMQQEGCWPVWVSGAGLPFAEDLVAAGIDISALPVVRTESLAQSLRAAERVMRSGVCGLVVVDVGDAEHAPAPMMGRLLKLAQRTETACVLLSTGAQRSGSLSPLISLRLQVEYGLSESVLPLLDPTQMPLEAVVVRDKRSGRRDTFCVQAAMSPGFYPR